MKYKGREEELLQDINDTFKHNHLSNENYFSYHELIESAQLQKLQDEFCKVTGVIAYCLDSMRNRITQISGNTEGIAYVEKVVSMDKVSTILDRIEGDSIEEQAVEDISVANIKLAAISIRIREEVIINWIVIGRISDILVDDILLEEQNCIDENSTIKFYQILDLLRDASTTLFYNKLTCFSAEAESRRSHFAEVEMSRNLQTIEATTAIVQLLDSDEQIETIVGQALEIIGKHLGVSSSQLLQLA